MPKCSHLILLLFLTSIRFYAQNTEISRRMEGELQMTFPSIYFKHQSANYAPMPYTADSCFNYIALHIKDIHDLVIWRDSLESEKLSHERIKKLKAGLNTYLPGRKVFIISMGKEQKISRHTLQQATDEKQLNYLLSLNSVFDIAKIRFPKEKTLSSKSHILRPKIWCWGCWKSGFHLDKKSRTIRKMERSRKKAGN